MICVHDHNPNRALWQLVELRQHIHANANALKTTTQWPPLCTGQSHRANSSALTTTPPLAFTAPTPASATWRPTLVHPAQHTLSPHVRRLFVVAVSAVVATS